MKRKGSILATWLLALLPLVLVAVFYSRLPDQPPAFMGCSALKEIVIPPNVTSIGDRAFQNCDSLTKVDIQGENVSIGNSAFYMLQALKEVMWQRITDNQMVRRYGGMPWG